MKKHLTLTLTAVTAVTLLSGCNREGGNAEGDGHDHASHDNGGHAETKDGTAMCGEHGVPEAECAVCKPELAAKLKAGESMKVRLPSTNSTAIVGVQTVRPENGAIADGVECVAEMSFNLNKLAQVAAPVGGIVQSVEVDLGSHVQENQTLTKLWSASIAEAVAKAVLTHQTLDRERKLRKRICRRPMRCIARRASSCARWVSPKNRSRNLAASRRSRC